MSTTTPEVLPLFKLLLESSWQASLLVFVVVGVQGILRRRLTPGWRHALWWIVLGRLLIPMTPASSWSLFNLLPTSASQRIIPIASTSEPSDWRPILGTVPLSKSVADSEAAVPPSEADPAVSTPVVHRASPAIPLGGGLVLVWALGSIFLLSRLFLRHFWFARRTRSSMRPADPNLLVILEECRVRMGVRRRIELLQGDAVASPAVFGLLRPRLLLPHHIAETCPPDRLRHIFLHELAHVRRGDLLVHGLTRVLQALHWFNPVLAWAFRRLRADRELATDALALQVAGPTERRAYGLTIVELLENWSQPTAQSGTVGILEDNASLERRIRAIAQFRPASRWAPLSAILMVALAAASWTGAQAPITEDHDPGTPKNLAPLVALEGTRVRAAGDKPGIGRLAQFPTGEADREEWRAIARKLLSEARAAQLNEQPTAAAKAFEASVHALSELGTNAAPESLTAIEGVRSTRLELARRAFDEGRVNEANAHLDRLLQVAPADPQALALSKIVRDQLATQLTQDAGVLFNAGDWRKADETVGRAVDLAPTDERALRLRERIREARKSLEAGHTQTHSLRGREKIQALLESIRLREIGFDPVPLAVAVHRLRELSMAGDPTGVGVNFFMNPYLDHLQPPEAAIEPNTGEAITPQVPPRVPLRDVILRIDPPLRGVRLLDVLKALTESAETPIQFVVEEYAVVLMHKPPRPPRLVTRVYRVNPERLESGLESTMRITATNAPPSQEIPGSSPVVQEKVRQLFQDLGVSLLPPNAVFFNDRLGLLMVRATPEEIETIDAGVEALNAGTIPVWEPSTNSASAVAAFSVPSPPHGEPHILILSPDGPWTLNRQPFNPAELETQLRLAIARQPAAPAVLRVQAESRVRAIDVVQAVALAKAAGFTNVSITKQPVPQDQP